LPYDTTTINNQPLFSQAKTEGGTGREWRKGVVVGS
jgi:hypothetical protein